MGHLLTPYCGSTPHLLDPSLGTSRQPYYTGFLFPQKFFLVLKDPQEENIHVFPFISRHGGDTPPGWGRRKTNGYKTCKDQLQWRWHQQGIKAPNVSTCRCLRICTHTHRGPSTQGWGQMQRLVTAHSCLEYCNYMYSECQQNGKTVLVRACGKLEPPWPLGTPPGHFFLLTSSHCHWPGHWWAPLAGVGAVTP